MPESEVVHLSADADGHGGQKLLCNNEWVYGLWGPQAYVRKDLGLGGGIYRASDGKNTCQYTFADAVATCQECIDKRCATIHEENRVRIDEYLKKKKPL